MRSGCCSFQQALTPEAATMVKQAMALARLRGHAQVTPLHVASTMLSASTGLLRTACLQSHTHPLQCRALELCFNVSLNRLPTSMGSPIFVPCVSNALVAAFKRAQAHQRRGSIENQQQSILVVKIEPEQLIVSILDDPGVSRVMREAGFSSPQVKSKVEQAVSLKICSNKPKATKLLTEAVTALPAWLQLYKKENQHKDTRPLLTTRTIELVGYDKLGAGQNATVAVMSNTGYDIDDAIAMTKASLDRGFGRCIVMKNQYRPAREYFKGPEGETQVVDRVALCSDKNGHLCIKYIIRHTRRPELGNKFSSRHGQKGVCGTIISQEDFPFSERGICPDLIMNPHGFPSKAGVSCGRFHYGSAFGERSGHADKVETISANLIAKNFSYSGKDLLYAGLSGEPLQAYIFMGPIYYQKLKHMVYEWEKWNEIVLLQVYCLWLIYERLMVSSDPFEVQV